MPSKKYILNKIRELEQDLIKLKGYAFEHYAIDSQETKSDNKMTKLLLSDSSPDTFSTKSRIGFGKYKCNKCGEVSDNFTQICKCQESTNSELNIIEQINHAIEYSNGTNAWYWIDKLIELKLEQKK